jgi:hypothetical protein
LENAEQQAISEASTSSNSPDSPRNPPVESKSDANHVADAKPDTKATSTASAPSGGGGGFLQWTVIIVVVFYLLINHFRWRRVAFEVNELQDKIKALEAIVSKLSHT